MERASITTPDWAAALDGWTVAGTTEWLHSLPSALQGQLHAHLPTGGAPPPPPWDAAAGSVPDLLTELGSSLKPYAATLAEYEYERVAQLQALGRDGLREELKDLGVTPDHRDKLCSLAFTPRPCGSLGGAFSREFLAVARPLHASHMGCENMGPMLYALCRFVKPGRVLEVGAGYTSLWLLQALGTATAPPLHRRCTAAASPLHCCCTAAAPAVTPFRRQLHRSLPSLRHTLRRLCPSPSAPALHPSCGCCRRCATMQTSSRAVRPHRKRTGTKSRARHGQSIQAAAPCGGDCGGSVREEDAALREGGCSPVYPG